ncbi:hypothetical protein [Thermoactinospora rubra]|uniref:hypothetical protein n=1 Tax=Thermoactinospora rubra TaxID=1088767 RepID=UPI000A120083|nr:hypothetical protein [Thermoactinospora rubra]
MLQLGVLLLVEWPTGAYGPAGTEAFGPGAAFWVPPVLTALASVLTLARLRSLAGGQDLLRDHLRHAPKAEEREHSHAR